MRYNQTDSLYLSPQMPSSSVSVTTFLTSTLTRVPMAPTHSAAAGVSIWPWSCGGRSATSAHGEAGHRTLITLAPFLSICFHGRTHLFSSGRTISIPTGQVQIHVMLVVAPAHVPEQINIHFGYRTETQSGAKNTTGQATNTHTRRSDTSILIPLVVASQVNNCVCLIYLRGCA